MHLSRNKVLLRARRRRARAKRQPDLLTTLARIRRVNKLAQLRQQLTEKEKPRNVALGGRLIVPAGAEQEQEQQ